jgi:hypothetical protein
MQGMVPTKAASLHDVNVVYAQMAPESGGIRAAAIRFDRNAAAQCVGAEGAAAGRLPAQFGTGWRSGENQGLTKVKRLATIKARSILVGAAAIFVILVVAAATLNYLGAVDATDRALDNRYQSYLLADELRQSSEDLTRLARTYVVTGDPSFETQYNLVVAIRNGDLPRPEAYNRVYWSFIGAGEPAPRPSTEAVPLLELMKRAGFTQGEFDLLEEANKRSNGLIALEVEAMNAVKG